MDPTTLGGRGSSVPSLQTSDDSSCDTASDDGAQSGRRLCPTSFRFRMRWQRRSHSREDLRGRINVRGKILPPCSPPPLHTAAAPIEPHKFSSGSSINDGSTLCFPCAEENENLQIQNSTPCSYLQMCRLLYRTISSKTNSDEEQLAGRDLVQQLGR